jgi:YVTN family beta-propeller protein
LSFKVAAGWVLDSIFSIMRLLSGFLVFATISIAAAESVPLSPTALAASPDGKVLYVACATANCVLYFDAAGRKVLNSIPMPESPMGLALSSDGSELFVTCAAPESRVCIVDVSKAAIVETIPAGHTTMAPVPGPDGKTLYVCNRFNNDVGVIDLAAKKEVNRIAVQREPFAAAITTDGKFLLVANHLHSGRADRDYVAAVVSVIDLAAGKVVKELPLPDGSGSLKDIRVSPDGKYAAVIHIVSRFHQPTTSIYRGGINANALSIIDLGRMEFLDAVLLDDPRKGAANPWGLAWSADGKTLIVTHAGTHEISVINFPALLEQLSRRRRMPGIAQGTNPVPAVQLPAAPANELSFILDSRRRVKLPQTDLGPRAAVVVGHAVYVANYYSDTLDVIDLTTRRLEAVSIPLGPKQEMSLVRQGEFYFNDAGICLQGWQSCYSCHPGDARSDELNWDLVNDGIGNPKNNKSLLLAYKTPPAMSLGVRASAEDAVRAGIKGTLFTKQPEEVPAAIDAYLKSLKPVPSPWLVNGRLSEAAERGKTVFNEAGCAKCHPPGLFTNLHSYDVGTRRSFDKPIDKFDTPTLVEIWRTAPYLHDGSAATLRDVLTTGNPHDQHGVTSNLSSGQIDDLCEYLLSL